MVLGFGKDEHGGEESRIWEIVMMVNSDINAQNKKEEQQFWMIFFPWTHGFLYEST